MEYNKYSLMGTFDLTRKYQQDIYDRKPLASVLSNRKIRFINPEGKFDYTTFGNFYFPTPNKMMLITTDNEYTRYHKPDQLSNTLWSTVPVIFAGVSTGWEDDTRREIYTGDIVTAKNRRMTSVVRYLSHLEQPSLAGDNCDLLFTDCKEGLHIEGTSFCDLTSEMFKFVDIHDFMWATGQYCQGGYSVEEVILKARSSSDRPRFRDTLKIEERYSAIYMDDLSEFMKGDFEIVFFCETFPVDFSVDFSEELSDEYDGVDVYSDNYPEGYEGKTHFIELNKSDDLIERFREPLHDFMLYAHRHPKTKFILCDFVKALKLNFYKRKKDGIAELFYPIFDYCIKNIILPSWLLIDYVSFKCVGRD